MHDVRIPKSEGQEQSKVYMIIVTDPSEENGQQFVRPIRGNGFSGGKNLRRAETSPSSSRIITIRGEKLNPSPDPSRGSGSVSPPTHQRGTVQQFVRPLQGERSRIRPTQNGERFQRSKKLKISHINRSSDPSRGNGSTSRPTHQGERSTIRPTHQGGTVYSTSHPSRGNGFNGGKNKRRAETPPSSSPSLSSPSSGKGIINRPTHQRGTVQ